jgi:aminotransferase
MTKIHQYTIMCVPITSQMAACEALQTGKRSVEEMKREYKRRRQFLLEGLGEIGLGCVRPNGAFYVFTSIKNTGLTSLDFAQRLLKQENVAVVPGTAFGRQFDDYIRISYATDYAELKEALGRIKNFVSRI